MKKSDITKKKILEYIKENPWNSNTQIANFMWLTSVATLYHLQELIKENLVYKVWETRATRYFPKEKEIFIKLSPNFFQKLLKDLEEEYEGLENIDLKILLNDLLVYLWPDWVWKYWIEAFIEKVKKENNWILPNEKLLYKRLFSFFISFFEEERKRRKNGFFDWTESLKTIMKFYKTKTFIDKLLFTQIATLPHFWRLRTATELYYWKLDQNKYLLEKSILKSIDLITQFIQKNNIKYAIFTPPTIKRQVQFRDVLKELLEKNNIFLDGEKTEKIKSDLTHTLRPQKELKWFDRIINAKKTILIENTKKKFNKIVIFDDNFTTGATINFIAEKLRFLGYKGEIFAITITWNFEYIPWVTDIWEI